MRPAYDAFNPLVFQDYPDQLPDNAVAVPKCGCALAERAKGWWPSNHAIECACWRHHLPTQWWTIFKHIGNDITSIIYLSADTNLTFSCYARKDGIIKESEQFEKGSQQRAKCLERLHEVATTCYARESREFPAHEQVCSLLAVRDQPIGGEGIQDFLYPPFGRFPYPSTLLNLPFFWSFGTLLYGSFW